MTLDRTLKKVLDNRNTNKNPTGCSLSFGKIWAVIPPEFRITESLTKEIKNISKASEIT